MTCPTASGSFAPTVDGVAARPGPRLCPRRAARRGASTATAQLIDRNGKAIVLGGAPNLGFSIAERRLALQPARRSSPATGRERRRGRDRQGDRETEALQGRRRDRRAGRRRRRAVQDLRHRQVRLRLDARRRDARRLRPADRAAPLRARRASSTRSRSRRSPACRSRSSCSRCATILPPTAQVRTGEPQARRTRSRHDSFISFLRDFLLAFGGIALFVGSFVIANSLSITIAQRTREFATHAHARREPAAGARPRSSSRRS